MNAYRIAHHSRAYLVLGVLALTLMIAGLPAARLTPVAKAADAKTITFDDPVSLQLIGNRTFTNGDYQEHGMFFHNGVFPHDPALATGDCGGFFVAPLGEFPEQGRMLLPHSFRDLNNDCVIQLTYGPPTGDPNRPQPRPFNLTSIQVVSGRLNVGIKSSTGGISVYYLTGPGVWGLPGADNIVRATLEVPPQAEGRFVVDNIVFEPLQ